MEPLRLAGRVVRGPLPFAPWSAAGPPVVHDGDGVETLAVPTVLSLACPGCEAPVRLDVATVLSAAALPARSGEPWVEGIAAAYGLVVHGAGDFRAVVDDLGLLALPVRLRCTGCARPLLAVLAYGEYQPMRWVATFHGLAVLDT
ncbi:hypothetical protein [Kineosporia sp. A_224]|uniref:hypothetical protein n=1 Tax=Kineosporia sp. A_224 TaxID=1962180 RepID=UPI0013042146|nr:hypothetical protein [Kineosporia sp. A_224]